MAPSMKMFLLSAACCLQGSGAAHAGERRSLRVRQAPAATASPFPYRQRLENRRDMQYHSKITLGGQEVDAIFDTGSHDLLVISQRCKQCKDLQYLSNESTSYHSLNKTAEHVFGSGPATTHMAVEDFSVGPVHVQNQVIHEIVSHGINILDKASFDAIVGIGPDIVPRHCNESVLCSLNVSSFSVCLGRQKGSPGWLTWGSQLTTQQKQQAVELVNVGKYHWTVSMRDIMPVGLQLSVPRREAAKVLLCGKGCAAILDSGTSLIAAPSHSLNGLRALLPHLHPDCSNFHDLPELEFTLNGRVLRLPPSAYALRLSGSVEDKAGVSSFLHFKQPLSAADVCIYGFINSNRDTEFGPMWIFGMPFFRHYHVTFGVDRDESKRRIWLSSASDTCDPAPLPEASEETKWSLADAAVKGPGVYPRVIVAQEGSKVQRSSSAVEAVEEAEEPAKDGPLTFDARELLESGGLLPRWDSWQPAEAVELQ